MTPDYEAIYRRANPPLVWPCPHSRQPELRDLWPCDQEAFKRMVDAALKGRD